MAYLKNQWSVWLCLVVTLGFTNQMPAEPGQDGLVFTHQYCSALTSKANFYEFWQTAIAQLSQWPAQIRRNQEDDELQFQGLAGRRCTAAYSVPPGCRTTGAILHIVEKGNLKRHLSWHDGYAHLCINWYPADEDRQWNPEGLPDRQAYVLAEAIVDATRGVEVVLSQPEVLANRVGIIGEGLGGGIAIALAALMPDKVSFVIANEPWPAYHYPPSRLMPQSSQVADALATYAAQYPHWCQAMRRSTSYFDIINFAGEVEAPTLIVLPHLAQFSSPSPAMIIYDHLRCEKQLLFVPLHGRSASASGTGRKEICHQWAQWATTRTAQYQAKPTGAYTELPIPEHQCTAPGQQHTLREEREESQSVSVPAVAVHLSHSRRHSAPSAYQAKPPAG